MITNDSFKPKKKLSTSMSEIQTAPIEGIAFNHSQPPLFKSGSGGKNKEGTPGVPGNGTAVFVMPLSPRNGVKNGGGRSTTISRPNVVSKHTTTTNRFNSLPRGHGGSGNIAGNLGKSSGSNINADNGGKMAGSMKTPRKLPPIPAFMGTPSLSLTQSLTKPLAEFKLSADTLSKGPLAEFKLPVFNPSQSLSLSQSFAKPLADLKLPETISKPLSDLKPRLQRTLTTSHRSHATEDGTTTSTKGDDTNARVSPRDRDRSACVGSNPSKPLTSVRTVRPSTRTCRKEREMSVMVPVSPRVSPRTKASYDVDGVVHLLGNRSQYRDVLTIPKKLVVLLLTTDVGSSRRMLTIFQEVAKGYPGVIFANVNVNQSKAEIPELESVFTPRCPIFRFFVNGAKVRETSGPYISRLREAIKDTVRDYVHNSQESNSQVTNSTKKKHVMKLRRGKTVEPMKKSPRKLTKEEHKVRGTLIPSASSDASLETLTAELLRPPGSPVRKNRSWSSSESIRRKLS